MWTNSVLVVTLCVAGTLTGVCGAQADPDGEGTWASVTFPTGQNQSRHFPLPQRAAQPETAFRFLRSCPSRAQAEPPDALFKSCQYRSAHTLITNRPVQAANSNSLPGRRLPLADRETRGLRSGLAHPALGRAGGVSSRLWAHRPRLCQSGWAANQASTTRNKRLWRLHSEPGTETPCGHRRQSALRSL